MKRIFKRLFAVLIVILLIGAASGAWLMSQKNPQAVPVLNYHQINDQDHNALTVSTDQFRKQMKYLAENGYHTITPGDMLDAWENGTPLPENPVIITFDDGYIDNYRNAYPILEEYGLKATIFLISDYIGTYPNYMTWDQAAEMQQSGLIDFESHTLSHEQLDQAPSTEELQKQLMGSKQAIEYHLQKKVEFIAYPCGTYNEEVEQLTRDAGYRAAFTVHYGLADPTEQRFILDRVPIFGGNRHTFMRYKMRVNYAPIVAPLEDLRLNLRESGHTFLSGLLLVP